MAIVQLIQDPADWRRHAERWDELARGVPFRSYAWLSTWWEYYGGSSTAQAWPRLFIVAVCDDDGAPFAFAPWMLTHTLRSGRVLSMLGTGEVFSDYLSLPAQSGRELEAADQLAQWLCGPGEKQWDIIDLTGVDLEDHTTNLLVAALEDRGRSAHRRQGLATWRLMLPTGWEEYLERLSKNHRKKIRRLERGLLDVGQTVVRQAERADELPAAFQKFVDLHQRRWQSLGQPGCFASPRFAGFLSAVTPRLFAGGQLRLLWLEHHGRPIAADYMLAGNDVLYSYQGGIDPQCLDLQPGRLGLIAALRSAIDDGYRCYDFLRGNEPYKAAYGAEPRPTAAIRVVSPRIAARLRNHAWQASQDAKAWVKQRLLRRGATGEASEGAPAETQTIETPQPA